MRGTVGVLNVGAGDTKLSFDPKNPAERIRAARIVRDMIRRGYALLIEVEPNQFQRAHDFDEERCEYIIADFDPVAAAQCSCPPDGASSACPVHGDEKARGQDVQASGTETAGEAAAGAGKKKRGGRRKRVDAGSTRAVAVGRTAGG